jgi:hypothetical protein
MKTKQKGEFVIKISWDQYSKQLQKMFDYLRYKKATVSLKATQKRTDTLVDAVRKNRKEKNEASLYL